jgi:hypothetical protein
VAVRDLRFADHTLTPTYSESGLRRANSPSEILSQFGKILEFGKTRSAN